MSPEAIETLQLIKDTHFLRRDLERAIRNAATWTGEDEEHEFRIAKEITSYLFREFLYED